MYTRQFVIVLVISTSYASNLFCKSLSDPKGLCAKQSKCRKEMAILVRSDCRELAGDEGICTTSCAAALKRFFQNKPELKNNLGTCDCGDDFKCIVYRRRFKRCLTDKKIANRNSCTFQKERCFKKKNHKCRALYVNDFDQCTLKIHGMGCPDNCKNAQMELYSNKIGRKFKDCTCDGTYSDEKFCLEVRANEKRLCTT